MFEEEMSEEEDRAYGSGYLAGTGPLISELTPNRHQGDRMDGKKFGQGVWLPKPGEVFLGTNSESDA